MWWFEGSFWCLLDHNPQNPLDLLFRLEAENRAERRRRRRRTQCASSFCGFGSCIFHLLCTCSFLPYVSLPISISPLFRLIGLCSRHCTKQMRFLSFCYGANSCYEPLCFVVPEDKKTAKTRSFLAWFMGTAAPLFRHLEMLVSPAPTGRLLITSSAADGHKTKCVCLWWFFSLVFEVPT